jgi:hypothetical protein
MAPASKGNGGIMKIVAKMAIKSKGNQAVSEWRKKKSIVAWCARQRWAASAPRMAHRIKRAGAGEQQHIVCACASLARHRRNNIGRISAMAAR